MRAPPVPDDRKYVKSHEWAKLDGDVATVGITEHAQKLLGEIVFADLPDIGTEAVAGERAAALESVKAAADIYAPIAGEIVQVNESLQDAPDAINEGPHEDGWLFKIKVSDPSDMDSLLDAKSYEKLTEE